VNLEVEVYLTSRVVQISTNSVRAAEAYGKWYESGEDEDYEELLDLIEEDVHQAVEIEITDVRMGRPAREHRPLRDSH
jgi:hypothetical protein